MTGASACLGAASRPRARVSKRSTIDGDRRRSTATAMAMAMTTRTRNDDDRGGDRGEDERRVDVILKPAGGLLGVPSASSGSGSPNSAGMDFRVRAVRRSATVRALKDAVRAGYEGNPEPERVVLIYGGKVLRDEDVIGEALTIGATGAAAYGYDVDGDDVSEDEVEGGVTNERGDGETNGSESEGRGAPRRRTREYVLHMMIRKDPRQIEEEEEEARAREKAEKTRREDDGDASVANASTATPSAAPSAAPTTPTQSTETSMDPGTPAVFASSAPRTPPSHGYRAADSARFTLPTTPEFQSAITDAMRAAQQSPRHLPLELAASPLMNATYNAAYHAAFAALSPSGTPPGPPPLAGLRSYLDVPHAATGARSEHDERARRREERQERQQRANGLPPELNIPPGARVRVIHIRIDLKLIMKLAMMVFFLSQDASPLKVTMYVAMAIFVYLQQTGALAPVLRWLTGNDNLGRGDANHRGGNRQGNGAAANGNRAPNAANDAQRYAVPTRVTRVAGHTTMPQTYFGEVKIFIYSLFASLFPSWLPPRLHEAGAQAAPRREHQD